MKIAFLPGSCVPFDGATLQHRPLGGTETAVIRLAEALDRLGHKVFVFTQIESPQLTKPLYLPYRALQDLGEVDVVIAVRELLPLFSGLKSKARYFWTGDSYDQLQHLGLGDRRVIRSLTALLAVSNWQADRLCAISGFPRDRSYILRNGFASELFTSVQQRSPNRLVYTSTPYRGLAHLIPIFPKIREEVPEAELHVYSSMKVYETTGAKDSHSDRQFEPIFRKLGQLPGVTLHGSIKQAELAHELSSSSLFVYPNTFEETSCIASIEALAAGLPVITSRRGALPETVSDAGMFIEGDPQSAEYRKLFVSAAVNVLKDTKAWQQLHERALARASLMTWDTIAHSLAERLIADSHQSTTSSAII